MRLRNGFIGAPAIFGLKTSALRVIVQTNGTARRVDVLTLRRAMVRSPELRRRLYLTVMNANLQASQIAACNRLHEVENRLARWLLMTQDRVGSESLQLTQEFLGHMLGTRRSSVSVAAGILQKAGMIAYTRGNVTIQNRKSLIEASCDCYGIIRRQEDVWRAESQADTFE